jgi:hypothetical protein
MNEVLSRFVFPPSRITFAAKIICVSFSVLRAVCTFHPLRDLRSLFYERIFTHAATPLSFTDSGRSTNCDGRPGSASFHELPEELARKSKSNLESDWLIAAPEQLEGPVLNGNSCVLSQRLAIFRDFFLFLRSQKS